MFFKNKIQIWSNLIPSHIIKDSFKIYPNNIPSYFKKIPLHPENYKFKNEKTVRSCPGFVNFFKKSVSVYSPFDFEIIKDDKGIYTSIAAGALPINDGKRFQFHDHKQFLSYVQSDYCLIGKFVFDIWIKSDSPVVVSNNFWFMNQLNIMDGLLANNQPQELNFFVAFPNNFTKIFIKKGDPLFSLFCLTDKKIKLVFNKNKLDPLDYDNYNYNYSAMKTNKLKCPYE